MDGQHRLSSAVESGKDFRSLIVAGVQDTDDVMAAIDEGMRRTGEQILHMAGFRYPVVVSGMCDTVYRYFRGLTMHVKVDNVAKLHIFPGGKRPRVRPTGLTCNSLAADPPFKVLPRPFFTARDRPVPPPGPERAVGNLVCTPGRSVLPHSTRR
jgi:hypothetical protein